MIEAPTEPRGLTAEEVAQRVAAGRTNALPSTTTRTVGQIVRANVFTRFNALLGSMLAIILVVGPLQDALFGFVLIANALIGIVQEVRAKRTLDRLTLLSAPRARVRRDGATVELAVGYVVADDVVLLATGDQIVVDGPVLTSEDLEVDESLLTGESDPVDKSLEDEVRSGSFVVAGAGAMRAAAVGAESYAARIAQDARRFAITRSELQRGTDRILRWITFAIVPTAALLFWSQLRADPGNWRHALSGAVAGTVAMVPEGLVLLTSLAFAMAVVRLARRRVLVQELPAVEGLARVDVLCIDKTGTLTEGVLAVERVVPLGGFPSDEVEPALGALAGTDPSPNATSASIAQRFGTPAGWTRTEGVPFSSARKWSAGAFEGHGAWILGAPDVLSASVPLPADASAALATEVDRGARVLLLARVERLTGETLPAGLEPAAFVVLADRLRPDAAETLGYFREQGVRVVVISGDHPRTVGAIAASVGLDDAEPVDARELGEEPDPATLGEELERHGVFGRVTPHQKRAMVAALQARGHTVAMTGDGVNDALALKDADLGIAMGSGSAATRSVAQLVLLDSTFDALPSVVGEGRRVLGNIERTSGLYLTKTVYATVLALVIGLTAVAFPFLPRHLTLIGAFTIGIPSFFLALAPSTDRFRPGFVQRVVRFALPAGILAAVATLLAYWLAREEPGVSLQQARTTAVMVLTWVGFAVLSIVAAPLRGWRLALVWSMAVGFVAVLLIPFTREFFALDPPPLIVWLAGVGIAAIVWTFARLAVPGDSPVGPRPSAWRGDDPR
jgi:cation-transporting ATPase E